MTMQLDDLDRPLDEGEEMDPEIAAAWAAEIIRRIDEEGDEPGIPHEVVMADVDKLLRELNERRR